MEITHVEKTNANENKHIIIWAVIIGLMFGFYVGRTWGKKAPIILTVEDAVTATTTLKNEKPKEVAVDISKTATAPLKIDEKAAAVLAQPVSDMNTFTVANQKAGNVVLATKAVVSRDSWIVIREDADGEMGKILGATWIPKGSFKRVTIELLRSTIAGKKYYAVLYSDNGDGTFNTKNDKPIIVGGKAISEIFKAE